MATAPPPGEIEDAPEEPILGNAHWLAQFTKEERKEILTLDDRKSVLTLVINWSVTFGAMAMVGASSGLWLLLTIPIALFVIAGRQLGCAIVMHEAARRLPHVVGRPPLPPLPLGPSCQDRHRRGSRPLPHHALPTHEKKLRT